MDPSRKSVRTLGGLFIVFGLLVATHLGEFWPFSIYPMFSQAGNPWTRSVVRDVSDLPQQIDWQTVSFNELPGNTFAMDEVGINQNDVSNFIQKAGAWTPKKVNGMRKLFEEELDERTLLLMKVEGRLDEQNDTVTVSAMPYMLFSRDTTLLNPELRTESF